MNDATLEDQGLLVIVEDGAPEQEWMDARAEGVTASEIHAIAAGSRKTWRRILDDKLNGSTFHGNAHTARGHAREADLIAAAALLDCVVVLHGSGALFGSNENHLHRGTPDGLGIHDQFGHFIAEAKHHDTGYTQDRIPADHFDQVQWNMHVLDAGWALYVWGVEGVDGIEHEWVPRDDRRIAQLVAQADAFIAWREAGAPEVDDIPDDVDDAFADYARGLDLAAQGEKLKKAARPVIDEWRKTQRNAPGEPLRKQGSRASFFYEPKPDVLILDEEAWADAEPGTYAEVVEARARVAEQEAAALALYAKPKPVAGTFRVTPNGDQK